MLHIIVLGTAAGGGLPQWNCGCANCVAARDEHPEWRSTQASIAVSGDGETWFLVNASPDLRSQIIATRALHPKPGVLRGSPIAGVILTNGEVDAVAGRLTLRERSPFTLYAHEDVLSMLASNSIFGVLDAAVVTRQAVALGVPFRPRLPDGRDAGLDITPFTAPGKPALFLEGARETRDGDTLGLVIRDDDGGSLLFLAACARVTPEVDGYLRTAKAVFFDGTLWRDDEMIRMGLSQKTGQRMGHIAMDAAIPALAGYDLTAKYFLHINNSNPALRPGSPERQQAEAAGWHIPADGMEITL